MTERLDPETSDIEQLLRSAVQGDAGAVGSVLERFRNYLTLLARVQIDRRLQGKVDASDLVQDTFLAAHRRFSTFRGTTEAELAAWLRRILASHLTDLVRRFLGAQRRDVRLERQLEEELDNSSRGMDAALFARQSSPSMGAVRRERGVLLADALRRLPPDYAEVIALHYVEGLALPEVAARMDRTLDSVKKLWVRGLARLRKELGKSA